MKKKTGRNGGGITFRIELSEKPPREGGILAKLKGNKGAKDFIIKGGAFSTKETKCTQTQRWGHPWFMIFS